MSLGENCILFDLYFVHKGRFYKKPTVVEKKSASPNPPAQKWKTHTRENAEPAVMIRHATKKGQTRRSWFLDV